MKVLMVNTEYSRGGAAQAACRLHSALNESGASSTFAYGRGARAADEKSFYFGLAPEVYFHAFLTRVSGVQGYGSPLSTRRLERFLKDDFDIIHIHNLHGYYLDLSFVRFLGARKRPVVWTLHDGWPLTGRCPYLSFCRKWVEGCGDCGDLRAYPKSYVDTTAFMCRVKKKAFTSGWNPVIVTPSKWLREEVGQSFLGRFRTEVIPNGVDTDFFRPLDKIPARERLGLPAGGKVILLMAANLRDKRKGAGYLADALQQVDCGDLTVITVGKKPKMDRRRVGGHTVRHLGYTSDKYRLVDAYNAADLFCTTYLNDNFPNTVLEAMACGTPAVGFNSGGVPEQVTEGCGLLVGPADSEALGRAIEKLLKDDALRMTFSKNAREKAVVRYSMPVFSGSYMSLYRELAGRG